MHDTPVPRSRDIPLVDVFNLRDLGGYTTSDGRSVRWGRLFRGAGLQRLTGRDLEIVQRLGLATIIDLRTRDEVERDGVCPTRSLVASFHHLPMIEHVWHPATFDPAVTPERYLLARYQEMLDEGATSIARAFDLFSRPDGLPGVFYCAAGKDRTGVLAAIILDAFGVTPEGIVDDYHLSNERVERIRARALASRGASETVDQPRAFMQAPREAMRLLLAWIRETYGGTAEYLRGIGVSAAAISGLADGLFEVDGQ